MREGFSLNKESDSIIALLAAQCCDLEALLTLARAEEDAAGRRDFGEIMRVVGERALIGSRLESYHRQLSEMREQMTGASDLALRGAVARKTEALVVDIQAHDARTRPLLAAAREDIAAEALKLDRSKRGASAYLRPGRNESVACDKRV